VRLLDVPYYRGRGYGPGAWVLLVGAAGLAILLAYVLAGRSGVT
jgi:hypothetical protein